MFGLHGLLALVEEEEGIDLNVDADEGLVRVVWAQLKPDIRKTAAVAITSAGILIG